jgi:hypothetical protein
MRWTHITAALFLLAIPAGARAYTVKATSTGATLHWRKDLVELSIHDSMIARFGDEGAREALASAIAAWSDRRHGPALTLGPTIDAPSGFERGRTTNGIYAVSPWPYEKRLLAVTISSYDTKTGEILDTDILINGDEALVVGLRDEHYDLAAVLTHEIGHVLGLGESEAEPGSSMYPRIGKFDSRARTPSPDDFEGLHAIYDPVHHAPRLASIAAPPIHGLLALASFASGIFVLLVGAMRSHGAARVIRFPVRWSARDRWDHERLHS